MENLPHGVGDLLSNDGVTRFTAFVLVVNVPRETGISPVEEKGPRAGAILRLTMEGRGEEIQDQ